MTCILHNYLQNVNSIEQKVVQLQNIKVGQDFWNALLDQQSICPPLGANDKSPNLIYKIMLTNEPPNAKLP